MKIFFVRHLKTKGNYEKRYIGRTDEELDLTRGQQIEVGLPDVPDRIYCSPMKRCVQTAQMIYPQSELVLRDNLREMDFGMFENKTYEDLKEDLHYRKFIDGTEDPISGESRMEFKKRCIYAFQQILSESKEEEEIVIICHGGTIMSIMEAFEVSQKGFYEYQITNGGVLACDYHDTVLRIWRKEA